MLQPIRFLLFLNQPWMIFSMGFFLAVVLCFLFFYKVSAYSFFQKFKLVSSNDSNSDFSYEKVINDLELGIVVYSVDGSLSMANETSKRLLGGLVPTSETAFLELFKESHELLSVLLLDSQDRSITLPFRNSTLRIYFKLITDINGEHIARRIVLQDVDQEVKEEEERKTFVANVSHELKTPLTTIEGYSETLLDWGLKEKTDAAIKKDIQRIYDESVRMKRLVSNLLLLSSLDSKGKRPQMSELDLSYILKVTIDRMQHEAEKKKILLTYLNLSKGAMVFGESTSIERIVMNLISNAIKYTAENGKVEVELSSAMDFFYIKVKDNGIGIESSKLDKIFDRFYRVDLTGSRRHGGNGLGLSIAKELAHLHQGQIEVTSSLGIGSEFRLILPNSVNIFTTVIQRSFQGRTITEPIYQEAERELLSMAEEESFSISKLSDLTLSQIKILLGDDFNSNHFEMFFKKN